MSMRRYALVKRSVKVLVMRAVCKCNDVSNLNVEVSCSEAQCEGAYDKGSAQVS